MDKKYNYYGSGHYSNQSFSQKKHVSSWSLVSIISGIMLFSAEKAEHIKDISIISTLTCFGAALFLYVFESSLSPTVAGLFEASSTGKIIMSNTTHLIALSSSLYIVLARNKKVSFYHSMSFSSIYVLSNALLSLCSTILLLWVVGGTVVTMANLSDIMSRSFTAFFIYIIISLYHFFALTYAGANSFDMSFNSAAITIFLAEVFAWIFSGLISF